MLEGYTRSQTITLGANQYYLDTGILGTGDTEIRCSFFTPSETSGYIFGTRNTNSNTSQGQYNYYFSSTGTNYFGYNNNRSGFEKFEYTRPVKCYTKAETIETVDWRGFISTVSRPYASFTSNGTIIVGGLRNGTTITYFPVRLYILYFVIDGKEFVPVVEDATGTAGFMCEDTFYPCGTAPSIKLTIASTEGGKGYIKDVYNNEVYEMYLYYDSTGIRRPVDLNAEADIGYNFAYWENTNGDKFYEKELSVWIASDDVYTAHFEKIVDLNFKLGYYVMSLNYITTNVVTQTDHLYSKVIDAQINVDSTQKTTSTITLDGDKKFNINTPIFLYDPKGNIIYNGIVIAQENNVLTCREPLAIFDFDFLFRISSASGDEPLNLTKFVPEYVFYHYMHYAQYGTDKSNTDTLIFRHLLYNAFMFEESINPSINNLTYFEKTLPLISGYEVGNLEDYLLNISNGYYVYPKMSLIRDYGVPYQTYGLYYARMKTYTTAQLPVLTIGTNIDAISNLSITVEDPQYTILIVYNSAGTTLRGMYALNRNGEIEPVEWSISDETNDYIAYTNYKVKIEKTDDVDITPIADEIVSSGQYNHQISFTLDLSNNFYDIRNFEMGQRVMFYDGSKLYDSIITGLKYNVESNSDYVKSVDITMGKVRKTLTSKILLQGKKK